MSWEDFDADGAVDGKGFLNAQSNHCDGCCGAGYCRCSFDVKSATVKTVNPLEGVKFCLDLDLAWFMPVNGKVEEYKAIIQT